MKKQEEKHRVFERREVGAGDGCPNTSSLTNVLDDIFFARLPFSREKNAQMVLSILIKRPVMKSEKRGRAHIVIDLAAASFIGRQGKKRERRVFLWTISRSLGFFCASRPQRVSSTRAHGLFDYLSRGRAWEQGQVLTSNGTIRAIIKIF